MLKIIRFFWGYVVFSARGAFPERFLNLAARAGVNLFAVEKRDDILYCSVLASEYKALRRLARKSGIKISLREKHGLPFFIWRHRHRKGLLVGAVCFWLTLYFLSLYIWSIDVQGATAVDKSELDNLINSIGVSVGTLKSEIDAPIIEKSIMNQFENISWVSVNVRGSVLSLELKERVEPPDLIPSESPCNVKATREGQVVRMEVYQGSPEVKCGDAVVEGQLLVSGFVEDDFGVCNLRHADAKIFALTRRELKQEVALTQLERQPTGKVVVRKRLKLFGVELPLTLLPAPRGSYEKSLQIDNANVMGVSLPASHYKEIWTQFCEVQVTLTRDEAMSRAHKALEDEENELFKEMHILGCDKKEKFTNDKAILIASYLCEENIAAQEEIVLEE